MTDQSAPLQDGQLAVENLSISFGGLQALDHVSFMVSPGEIHGLIGPNGSGKTTLFNCITGFYVPESGRVLQNGRDITGRSARAIANLGIGRTFQQLQLFRSMTVAENVLVALERGSPMSLLSGMLRGENPSDQNSVHDILQFVGLRHSADLRSENLAFGHQRLLELARALACQPELLLLDEPSAGMNEQEMGSLADLIGNIRDKLGITIVLVAHTMRLVMGICDRITVLDHGQVIAQGQPEEIQESEVVIEAYLGRADSGVDADGS